MKQIPEEQFFEERESPKGDWKKPASIPEERFWEEDARKIEPLARDGVTEIPDHWGRIHSIESMGLQDGPGIRSVVFLQGCGLRCRYCHNPDTWQCKGGVYQSPETVFAKILRFKPYYDQSGGGITCSGGEPLLQPKFLVDFFKRCRDAGIHTCLDTAGFGAGGYHEILSSTDLVLLDIKHWDDAVHQQITGVSMAGREPFMDALIESQTPVWIRHVVVPGWTDSEEQLQGLLAVCKRFPRLEKVELLPYHTLGEEKYQILGIPYWMEGVPPMDRGRTLELEKWVRQSLGL